jgi:hypothetical protein
MADVLRPWEAASAAGDWETLAEDVVAICRTLGVKAERRDWITHDAGRFIECVVVFDGSLADGWRVLGGVLAQELPVSQLRRIWWVTAGEPCGPRWEILLGPFEDPTAL